MTRIEAEQLSPISQIVSKISKVSFLISLFSLIIFIFLSFSKASYEPLWFEILLCCIQAFFVYMLVLILALLYYSAKTAKIHCSFQGDLHPINVFSIYITSHGLITFEYMENNQIMKATASHMLLDQDSYYLEPEHIIVYHVFGNYYKTSYPILHLPKKTKQV